MLQYDRIYGLLERGKGYIWTNDIHRNSIYNRLYIRVVTIKGLCHSCFSSNEILTLNSKGLSKCEKCYEDEVTKNVH